MLNHDMRQGRQDEKTDIYHKINLRMKYIDSKWFEVMWQITTRCFINQKYPWSAKYRLQTKWRHNVLLQRISILPHIRFECSPIPTPHPRPPTHILLGWIVHLYQYGFTLSHENVSLCDLPTLQFHCTYNNIMRWLWIFSGTTCWTWREIYILHKESIQQSTRITVLVVFSLVVCSWEGWCYLLSIIFSLKLTDGKIWKSV